jgi:hypothetical protein
MEETLVKAVIYSGAYCLEYLYTAAIGYLAYSNLGTS